jgi:hypothetical protein
MWLLANKLTLNVNKTEYMLIGSRQRQSQINTEPILSIGSESIKRVSSTKTLGVIVDECITWKDHIHRHRKIDKWGDHIHIFVFTDLKNNRFQKKVTMQNTNI